MNSGSMLPNPLELSEIDAKIDNSTFNRNRELNAHIRELDFPDMKLEQGSL